MALVMLVLSTPGGLWGQFPHTVCGPWASFSPSAVTCWALSQDLAEAGKWGRRREAVWPLVGCGKWPKCLVPSERTGLPDPREEEGAPQGQCPPCHKSPENSRALGNYWSGSQLQWEFYQVSELGVELPPVNN